MDRVACAYLTPRAGAHAQPGHHHDQALRGRRGPHLRPRYQGCVVLLPLLESLCCLILIRSHWLTYNRCSLHGGLPQLHRRAHHPTTCRDYRGAHPCHACQLPAAYITWSAPSRHQIASLSLTSRLFFRSGTAPMSRSSWPLRSPPCSSTITAPASSVRKSHPFSTYHRLSNAPPQSTRTRRTLA